MGMMETVRSGTTAEELVRAIADAIVSGTLPPGARLDETGLARRHAVSRTPVRQALARLVAMGLVERRPNCGAVVATLGEEHLRSMFEAMTELEGICARLAAQRMNASERSRLEALHYAAMRLVHLGAEEDYARHNADFHSRLYDGAHSVHVCELAVLTRLRLAPFRRAQFRMPGRLTKSWDEHDTIVRAILRADVAGAEAAARAHVATVSDATWQFVRAAHARHHPA